MIFTEAIIWCFLHYFVGGERFLHECLLQPENANVLKMICHMHSQSPLNLMLIFKLHVISRWSASVMGQVTWL